MPEEPPQVARGEERERKKTKFYAITLKRVQVSLSGCHFLPCSEGLFRKMTLVFPCFAVYATNEKVSLSHAYMGRFPGNSQTKNDTLKMTLGRARYPFSKNPFSVADFVRNIQGLDISGLCSGPGRVSNLLCETQCVSSFQVEGAESANNRTPKRHMP